MNHLKSSILLLAGALVLGACGGSGSAPAAEGSSQAPAAQSESVQGSPAEGSPVLVNAGTVVYPEVTFGGEEKNGTQTMEFSEEEGALLDNDQVSVRLTSIVQEDNIILRGTIINKGDQKVGFMIGNAAINGLHESSFPETGILEAGESKAFELSAAGELESAGEFGLIQAEVILKDPETEDVIFDEVCSLFPHGENQAVRARRLTDDFEGLVFQDDRVEIGLLRHDNNGKRSLTELVIRNLSEDVIEVSFDNFTYNGTPLKPSMFLSSQRIFGLNEAVDAFSLLKDDTELNQDELETLEFTISIQNCSNGTTLLKDEKISIPLK